MIVCTTPCCISCISGAWLAGSGDNAGVYWFIYRMEFIDSPIAQSTPVADVGMVAGESEVRMAANAVCVGIGGWESNIAGRGYDFEKTNTRWWSGCTLEHFILS